MTVEKIDTLCIVDDDDAFQFLTKMVIEGTQLVRQVKVFATGLEAIEFLRSAQDRPEELPDIILLDLNMPIMDGWEFLEEYIPLKPKLARTITVYIVSSSIDPADMERARTISEVSDFIIKPVTKDKFLKIIKLM